MKNMYNELDNYSEELNYNKPAIFNNVEKFINGQLREVLSYDNNQSLIMVKEYDEKGKISEIRTMKYDNYSKNGKRISEIVKKNNEIVSVLKFEYSDDGKNLTSEIKLGTNGDYTIMDSYFYNSDGLICEHRFGGEFFRYYYTPNPNKNSVDKYIISEIISNDIKTEYNYSDKGLKIKEVCSCIYDGKVETIAEIIDYEYDKDDRLILKSSPSSNHHFHYDNDGRLSSEILYGSNIGLCKIYNYNDDNSLKGVVVVNDKNITVTEYKYNCILQLK